METKDKIFASKLKSVRCKQGMSQEALAEEMKCSLSTISRLERGTGSLRSKTFYDCLAWIEQKTTKDSVTKKENFRVDEKLFESIETEDDTGLKEILEELDKNTGWNIEKKRSLELYRLLGKIVSLYHSVGNTFFETDDAKQLGFKVTELFSVSVGTISDIDERLESNYSKELILLLNAYALTLVSLGLPYEAEVVLAKMYTCLQGVKYESLENYKALVMITNNLAYISLRLKKVKEAGVFLEEAWNNAKHCFSRSMLISILCNHKEVCKCLEDEDGYNRDETALEAVLSIESLDGIETKKSATSKVLFVF
jgi:transcriptional regulator with XRE-family HTH domain